MNMRYLGFITATVVLSQELKTPSRNRANSLFKMLVKAYSGLQFEASIRGKEEFGQRCEEVHGKGWILANSDKDIVLEINCFKPKDFVEKVPELLIELYVDGILRNVVRPRTGRGMAENQFAESKIDHGVVLTEAGIPMLEKFRFTDLDLDDAILKCRLVEEAGKIEVRITQSGLTYSEEDDIPFEVPVVFNDRYAVSMLCGEINNIIGVRFDDSKVRFKDKNMEARLQSSVDLMVARQNEMLGETLAIFSFQYGSNALLHHLGHIPVNHKLYDKKMANHQDQVIFRVNKSLSPILVRKAVSNSDYTLNALIGGPDKEQDFSFPAKSAPVVLPLKRQLAVVSDCPATKRKKTINATLHKKPCNLRFLLTPPLSPGVKKIVTSDTKQLGEAWI